MNWRKYLTPKERKIMARCDSALERLASLARNIRLERRLIQNRAYARGKNK